MPPAQRVVIVGNGVAGISAAMTLRSRDARASISVISGESDYFFSRTALMYAFMDRLDRRDLEPHERKVYTRQRIDLVRGWVTDLDATRRELRLDGDGAGAGAQPRALPFDQLLIATGAAPRQLRVPGLDDDTQAVVTFVSLQDLDACERWTPSTRQAVVVGGGLIGVELVECLVHHGVKVTFLVREPWYWPAALAREEGEMVAERMRARGVDVRHDDELASVERDGASRVAAVVTRRGERIDCQLLGVAIGVEPNVDWLRRVATPPALGRGVAVDAELRTSLDGVWAAGDCAEVQLAGRPPFVELIWYSAKRQGELAGRNLSGARQPYQPPLFFNSAMLFDVEYTTVGDLARLPDGARSLYRRHPSRAVSQRIVHHDGRVLGFNMLGSRWDHTVLARWIDERRDLDWVVEHLAEAQFDVEFGRLRLADLEERPLTTAPTAPAREVAS